MAQPSYDDAALAIDLIFDQFRDHDGLVAVELELNGEISMRYVGAIPKDIPSEISLESIATGKPVRFAVRPYEGPAISEAIGDVKLQPPRAAGGGDMGGDECRSAGSMDYYGTISFYAGQARYSQQGKCNADFSTSPVMISNNHVIARSDRAPIGEAIWTPALGHVAVLDHFLPIDCNADIAFGKVTSWGSVRSCHVRGIGAIIPTVKRVELGSDIYKCGARTGYTAGIVETIGTIRVQGREYRNVFRTSRGFGCGGDSGSVIVSPDRFIQGIYSWGEDRPCADDPKGWFFGLPISEPLGAKSDALEIVE